MTHDPCLINFLLKPLGWRAVADCLVVGLQSLLFCLWFFWFLKPHP